MKQITVTCKDLDYTANIVAKFYETREEYERAVGYKSIKRVWAQEFERGTRIRGILRRCYVQRAEHVYPVPQCRREARDAHAEGGIVAS